MMYRACIVVASLLALVLAACGGDSTPRPATPEQGSSPGPSPQTASPALARLQQDYDSLSGSYQAIADIWEAMAANQQARCGTYPDVLNPDSISAQGNAQLDPLAEYLRQAAIGIAQAVNLWRAECARPRAYPPPDVINQGLLATRAARDTLNQAQALLGMP